MIQFIKFATHDPEGFALIKATDISGIASTPDADKCRLTTSHGDYIISGSIEFILDEFRGLFGSEWTVLPEEHQSNE